MDTSIQRAGAANPGVITTIEQLREKLRPIDAADTILDIHKELSRVTEDNPMSRDVLSAKKILLESAYRTLALTIGAPKAAEVATQPRVKFVLNLGQSTTSNERVVSGEVIDGE